MSVDRIHDLVRDGRITPTQGADLMMLRRQIAWHRLPWWERLLRGLFA